MALMMSNPEAQPAGRNMALALSICQSNANQIGTVYGCYTTRPLVDFDLLVQDRKGILRQTSTVPGGIYTAGARFFMRN